MGGDSNTCPVFRSSTRRANKGENKKQNPKLLTYDSHQSSELPNFSAAILITEVYHILPYLPHYKQTDATSGFSSFLQSEIHLCVRCFF